jgi:tRNA-2-methylthio-N6-dimethylallyladenosine synthase
LALGRVGEARGRILDCVPDARRFVVRTFGCQMNEHDSERIASLLVADGMERVDDVATADVVVLNTCCIRQNADDRLYGHLGHLKSLQAEHPDLQIAVGGCLAQKDRRLVLERAPHVSAVFGTHNVGRVVGLLDEARRTGGPAYEILDSPANEDALEFPVAMAVRSDLPHAAWVTIQVGCDNSCAFCIVPSVRGPEVSRPFGDLVAEVRALAEQGTVEITLLGQNVNSYGRDLTTRWRRPALRSGGAEPTGRVVHETGPAWVAEGARRARPLFADLLRAAGAVEGIGRIRFTSPHPKDLRPETIAAMAETPAVCEQLHLPLQAGSDRVLAAMRRGYTAERYLERLAAARAAIDDLAVSTDIIVGFPGETEDDFRRTLEVVAEAEYDSAYTFIFSPRPGTRAADMADDFVPPEEVAERFDRLKVVVERSALAKHVARVGGVEEALVEGPSKKDPAVLTGRTRQGKLVHFTPPAGGLRPGVFARVRIDSGSPHHLMGSLLATNVPFSPAARSETSALASEPMFEPVRGRRRIPVGVPIHTSP